MSNSKPEGVQVRREVMGDTFVDRALNNATEFSQPLQEFVNEHAWGGVWNREGLMVRSARSSPASSPNTLRPICSSLGRLNCDLPKIRPDSSEYSWHSGPRRAKSSYLHVSNPSFPYQLSLGVFSGVLSRPHPKYPHPTPKVGWRSPADRSGAAKCVVFCR